MIERRKPSLHAFARSALLAAMVVVSLTASAAAFEASELATPGCLDSGEPHRVTGIGADLDLILDDGRRVLLAGLDLPRDDAWAATARTMVATWLVGRPVLVRVLSAEADRWDRTPALVYAEAGAAANTSDPGGRVSVAEAMIGAGLARARPDDRVAPCWATFLDLERRARAALRGLWRDPRYAAIAAVDNDGLKRNVGRMAIVEGSIVDAVEGRSRTYLHLTSAGRGGFAIVLGRRVAARLKLSGADRDGWRGRLVRVRGLLDDRFGMQIELTSADQIEFTGQM